MTARERAIRAFNGKKILKKDRTSLHKIKNLIKNLNKDFNNLVNFESLYYDLKEKHDSLEARHSLLICEMQEYVKSKENK